MATYEGYLKVRNVGTAGGQDINNTFYYGGSGGEAIVFNDAFMAVFAPAWLTQVGEDFLGEQTNRYTLQQVEVTALNRQGVTISDNAIEYSVGEPGDIDEAIPGPGLAAVISIKTSSIEAEDSRPLKRSYLAWGPVPKSFITDPTGELTLTAKTAYAGVAALISQVIVISGIEYWPVRIGRTTLPSQPAIGNILSVSVQPFPRPRTSRFFKADGT